MPTPRTPPSVGESYDDFDAAFKAARIPTQLYEALGDVWVDSPARAHHLIARFKDTGQTPAIKLKATAPTDDFDRLGQQFIEAGRARSMQAGADKAQVLKTMQTMVTQLAPATGGRSVMEDSGDRSVATKTAKAYDPSRDPLALVLGADQLRSKR